MIPPDDDSKQAATGCAVDLKTRTIQFLGCKDQEAMISAAEKRVTLVTSQLDARSGLTNSERRALNREANILRRWLFPDAMTPFRRRMLSKSINNATHQKRRIPTKRRAREARRSYREEHTHLQRRPDYSPTPVISMADLKYIRHLREIEEAKQAWFNRKHGREVNERACHDVAIEAGQLCAGSTHVSG